MSKEIKKVTYEQGCKLLGLKPIKAVNMASSYLYRNNVKQILAAGYEIIKDTIN